MNLVAHGIDLVENHRIAALLKRHEQRVLERLFTPVERQRADRLRDRVPHLAGRFAAKEAILKVLGTGWRGQIAWTDIEITNDEWGAPHVALSRECAKVAARRGISQIILSISHTEHYATASAIGVS